MTGGRIVVVEDERLTRAAMVDALRQAGFEVRAAADACACRAALNAEPADLIVLDLGLPGQDGLSYARELRAAGDVAVLVVTARPAADVEISVLDEGADGFLMKPVEPQALAAHVRALLRRRRQAYAARLHFGAWVLDLERRLLLSETGEVEPLTRGEFNLLALLAQAEGRIVSRELLSEAVNRGDRTDAQRDVRSVDALVSRLRRKLGSADLIGTATGFGYRLCGDVHRQ
jgi:DNA-binding response OmpR family regulator